MECTLIAPTEWRATLIRQRIDDPLGQDRRLYAVDGAGVPPKTAPGAAGAAGAGGG